MADSSKCNENIVDLEIQSCTSNDTFCSMSNEDLLKLLECHVCFKPMTPPIIQCSNGHNICHGCRKHLDSCATCKASFVEIRNRLAEDLALKLPYPCENSDAGCKLIVLGSELEDHGRQCPFRIYCCLLRQEQSCTWTGRKVEILKHIKSEHPQYLIEERDNQLKWSIDVDGSSKRVISALGEVYTFTRMSMANKSYTAFYLQYIGDEANRTKYRYGIELKSSDYIHSINFKSVPISDLKAEEDIISSEEYLILSKGFCKLLVNDEGEILYDLKITSNEFCPCDLVKYKHDVVDGKLE